MSDLNQAYVDSLRDEVSALRMAMSSDSSRSEINQLKAVVEQLADKVDRLAEQKSAPGARNWTGREITKIAVQAVEPALKAMVSALMDDDQELEQKLLTRLESETSHIKFAAASGKEAAERNKDSAVRFLKSYADLYVS